MDWLSEVTRFCTALQPAIELTTGVMSNQMPVGTFSPRWQVKQVTPAGATWSLHPSLMARVISIMRRDTTLV